MGVVEVPDPVPPARAGGWKVDVSRGQPNGRVSFGWFTRAPVEKKLRASAAAAPRSTRDGLTALPHRDHTAHPRAGRGEQG